MCGGVNVDSVSGGYSDGCGGGEESRAALPRQRGGDRAAGAGQGAGALEGDSTERARSARGCGRKCRGTWSSGLPRGPLAPRLAPRLALRGVFVHSDLTLERRAPEEVYFFQHEASTSQLRLPRGERKGEYGSARRRCDHRGGAGGHVRWEPRLASGTISTEARSDGACSIASAAALADGHAGAGQGWSRASRDAMRTDGARVAAVAARGITIARAEAIEEESRQGGPGCGASLIGAALAAEGRCRGHIRRPLHRARLAQI